MLSSKRILNVAKKWQKAAILGRRRILLSSGNSAATSNECGSVVTSKGCFVLYSLDGKRFMIPLSYLSHNILMELLKISEEEFGLPSNRPITLPCAAAFVEYVISLLGRHIPRDVEKALLASVVTSRCSDSSLDHLFQRQQSHPICGF